MSRFLVMAAMCTTFVAVVGTTPAALADLLFEESAPVYATDERPKGVAVGDLNGDGAADIVVACDTDVSVSVLLNNGDGTFAPKISYDAGYAVTAVAIADLNGDGHPDIALTGAYTSKYVIFINQGDGTFVLLERLNVGDYPKSFTLADLDGDGDIDLATANHDSGSVSRILNNGDGTFGSRQLIFVGDGSIGIDAGDLDGDGDVDMAVVNQDSQDVWILMNDGEGVFTPHATYGVDEEPSSIAICDLDGDGHPELIVLHDETYGHFSILVNQGDGTFAPGASYDDYLNWPVALSVGDLDGDDDPDIAVLCNNIAQVAIFENDGNGVFEARLSYGVRNETVRLAMGDMDCDGIADLAATHESGVSVLLNNGDATFASDRRYQNSTNLNTLRQLSAIDIDEDGDEDLVGVEGWYSPGDIGNVGLFFNNGDGTLADIVSYEVGKRPVVLHPADVDDDSSLDLVVLNNNSDDVSVLLGNGDGTFAPQMIYDWEIHPYSGAVCDLDGDGDLDVAMTSRYPHTLHSLKVLMGQGNGSFVFHSSYQVNWGPELVFARDLDGDGDLDLILPYPSSDALLIFWNYGDGTFAAPSGYALRMSPTKLQISDLDGDGDDDLILFDGDRDRLEILLNDGTGSFTPHASYWLGPSLSPSCLVLSDIDKDDDLDVLTLASEHRKCFIFLNQGGAEFALAHEFYVASTATELTVGDLNGDGDLDIATTNFRGTVSTYFNMTNFGACCLTDSGICEFTSEEDCLTLGGTFVGPGTACGLDEDGDGVASPCDNCPMSFNPTQEDSDADGVGNCCDPDEPDANSNGVADYCESTPNKLHVAGPIPSDVPMGQTRTIAAQVQVDFVSTPGWLITFDSISGEITFLDGDVSNGGNKTTAWSHYDDPVEVAFTADGTGPVVVRVTVENTTLPAAYTFFEVVTPPPSTPTLGGQQGSSLDLEVIDLDSGVLPPLLLDPLPCGPMPANTDADAPVAPRSMRRLMDEK